MFRRLVKTPRLWSALKFLARKLYYIHILHQYRETGKSRELRVPLVGTLALRRSIGSVGWVADAKLSLCFPTVCEKCGLGVSPSGAPFQDSGVFMSRVPPLLAFFMRGFPPHKTPPNKKTTRQRTKQSNAKPNTLNQSFFHPLDDVYVGSDDRNENREKTCRSTIHCRITTTICSFDSPDRQ